MCAERKLTLSLGGLHSTSCSIPATVRHLRRSTRDGFDLTAVYKWKKKCPKKHKVKCSREKLTRISKSCVDLLLDARDVFLDIELALAALVVHVANLAENLTFRPAHIVDTFSEILTNLTI